MAEIPEVLEANEPAQLKALAHPLRNRILFALGDGATVSQLAARFRTNKGNVAHHLGVLERAGLVRRAHTRQVRGGTEQYFTRAARRLRLESRPGDGHTAALLQAVADEIDGSPAEHLLNLRRVRLTRAQAAALAAHLDRLVDDLPEAGPHEPTHGVLVSVFQSGRAPR